MTRIHRRRFCALALAVGVPARSQAVQKPAVIPVAYSEALDAVFVSGVLDLLGKASGLRFDGHPVPFARVLRMAEQGEAVGFGVSPTAQRRGQLRFSRALFQGAVWAVSRRDAGIEATKVEALRGRVTCQSRQASYMAETGSPVASLLETQQISGDLSHRLRTLMAGHCDVLLVTSRSASVDGLKRRLRSEGADIAALHVPRRPLVVQDVYLGVARSSPWADSFPRVDSAIQAHREELERLAARFD